MRRFFVGAALALAPFLTACDTPEDMTPAGTSASRADSLLDKYTTVRLTTDLGALSENERRMIPLLIDAAREMDAVYWVQSYGDRDSLLSAVVDPALRRFVEINYG